MFFFRVLEERYKGSIGSCALAVRMSVAVPPFETSGVEGFGGLGSTRLRVRSAGVRIDGISALGLGFRGLGFMGLGFRDLGI